MTINLDSTFGMCEMEVAARIIIDNFLKHDSWSFNIRIFEGCENMALRGIVHLACNGWIKPLYPNSLFKVEPEFIERVKDRLP